MFSVQQRQQEEEEEEEAEHCLVVCRDVPTIELDQDQLEDFAAAL